jgi:hypothetical protein
MDVTHRQIDVIEQLTAATNNSEYSAAVAAFGEAQKGAIL